MKVAAVEHALPSRTVGNEELIQRILERRRSRGADPDGFEPAVRAFFERTGARERRHRAPGERAIDFGVAAARQGGQRGAERASVATGAGRGSGG